MFTGKILGDLIFPSPISHHRLYGFSPLGFVSTEQEFADTQYDGPLEKVDSGLKIRPCSRIYVRFFGVCILSTIQITI